MVKVQGLTTMAAQREWFEKDYYAVLGVSKDRQLSKTSQRHIGDLARQYHPDANAGQRSSRRDEFKDISAAYDVVRRRKETSRV